MLIARQQNSFHPFRGRRIVTGLEPLPLISVRRRLSPIVLSPLTQYMTMKRLTVRSRALVGTSALCLASVLRLSAQTTAPQTGQNQPEETPLELSPFVV